MNGPATPEHHHPRSERAFMAGTDRLLLPVAPRANVRPRFGAPPMPRQALSPKDALALLDRTMEAGVCVNMAGISGPGDPLATPETTLETLRLVRESHPDMGLFLVTYGLGGEPLAPSLAELGLSLAVVLMDAVQPDTARGLYAWVRPGRHTLRPDQACRTLIEAQARTITAFKEAGVRVVVLATVYPGLNDDHLAAVAEAAADLGADAMALRAHCPIPGDEDGPKMPEKEYLADLRTRLADRIPLDDACVADLAGVRDFAPQTCATRPAPAAGRPNVAVASAGGMDVDIHLGQAHRLLIFGPRSGDDLPSLLETRPAPEPGSGDDRWNLLADTLSDCFALLAASAGERPRQVLSDRGIRVVLTDENVSGMVDALYGGGKKSGCKSRKPTL